MEADALSVFCHQKDILVIVCYLYFDEPVFFPENDCCKSGLSYVCIFFDGRLLYKTFFCRHEEILAVLVFPDGYHGGNLLFRHELQQIDDCGAARRSASFRYLISFQAVYAPCVCKEHDIVVCRRHEQFADVIVFQRLHSLDAFSSAVLALECVHAHALDVSEICHRNHYIFSRYQVFHGDVKFVIADMRPSLVSVLFGNDEDFFFDDAKEQLPVCKDCLVFLYLFHQFRIF